MEWTKTDADALPWGEVVEVRWPYDDYDNEPELCTPSQGNHDIYWLAKGDNYHAAQGSTYTTPGSEWRRLERGPGEGDNGSS